MLNVFCLAQAVSCSLLHTIILLHFFNHSYIVSHSLLDTFNCFHAVTHSLAGTFSRTYSFLRTIFPPTFVALALHKRLPWARKYDTMWALDQTPLCDRPGMKMSWTGPVNNEYRNELLFNKSLEIPISVKTETLILQ